jgi:endonuclease
VLDDRPVHRAADADADDIETTPAAADTEFVLATQLEEFLLGHWSAVDWGRRLALWQGPDGTRGHQLSTPIGRLDLLCVDSSTNALVVVGLRRGRSADQVIGQVARYMGWVRAHLAADSQPVAGIVVAHQCDDRLRYAAAAVPGLTVLTYQVNFELVPAPEVTRS